MNVDWKIIEISLLTKNEISLLLKFGEESKLWVKKLILF